jgi:DNA polymerase-3 subunit alpha
MFLTHLHSVYSLSDSLITTDKLVNRLKELNMNKVAITDHGNLLHVQEFRKALKKEGLQHLPGSEMYLCNDIYDKEQRKSYHLTIIAKTEQGV